LLWGGSEQTKEAVRDVRMFWPDRFRLDVVHAWRALRARPGVSAAILLVLAAGIGLVTAMFALADPFVVRPLPYTNPEELAVITVASNSTAGPQWMYGASPASPLPTLADWRGRTDLFQSVAASSSRAPLRLRTAEGGASLETAEVTDGFLELLGVLAVPEAFQESTDGQLLSVMLTRAGFTRALGRPVSTTLRHLAHEFTDVSPLFGRPPDAAC
jgi:hypothetical protein